MTAVADWDPGRRSSSRIIRHVFNTEKVNWREHIERNPQHAFFIHEHRVGDPCNERCQEPKPRVEGMVQ